MKSLLIVCVLLLSAVIAAGLPQRQPSAITWEYKIEERCFDESRINALGSQGWELAGFSENGRGGWHCIFKRPK